jgi:two-component system, NarL family, invasion response regulator UvrY
MMIKVYIVDDHFLIREGLKKILNSENDFTVVGETGNSSDAYKFIKDNKVDILILDLSMPGKSGLEVLQELKMIYPELKVLVLTMYPEEVFAIRALKSGAMGYLTKDSVGNELITALRKIATGRQYISESLSEQLASNLKFSNNQSLHESLSDREFQIMLMIGKGKTISQIADEVSLSPSTIKTYRSRILLKMNMRTNADMVGYVVRNKLVE